MTELYPKVESKKPHYSKTLWVNLIMTLGAFIPVAQPFLTPENLSLVFLLANTVLRLTTNTGISIK